MNKKIKIGINGFGRIGSLIFRRAVKDENVEVVGINDPNIPIDYMCHLMKYDSAHGIFNENIKLLDGKIQVNDSKIKIFSENNPKNIDWKSCGAEYIAEASGKSDNIEGSSLHFNGGAKKVIITAPSKDAPMFVMGVNQKEYKKDTKIISNSSCITNCLAPLAKVINDNFGIEEAIMTSVHSATGVQNVVDGIMYEDWRAGRAVLNNIIQTPTYSAETVGRVIPELDGKLLGTEFRVPTLDVSAIDVTIKLEKETTYEDIKKAMKDASNSREFKDIIEYTEEKVVSSDFVGDIHTSIFDASAGIMMSPKFVKLIAWYDNEWSYACKVIDLMKYVYKVDEGGN